MIFPTHSAYVIFSFYSQNLVNSESFYHIIQIILRDPLNKTCLLDYYLTKLLSDYSIRGFEVYLIKYLWTLCSITVTVSIRRRMSVGPILKFLVVFYDPFNWGRAIFHLPVSPCLGRLKKAIYNGSIGFI